MKIVKESLWNQPGLEIVNVLLNEHLGASIKKSRGDYPKIERIVNVPQERSPNYSCLEYRHRTAKRATKGIHQQIEAENVLPKSRRLKVNYSRAVHGRVMTKQVSRPIYKDVKVQIKSRDSETSSRILCRSFIATQASQCVQRGRLATKDKTIERSRNTRRNREQKCLKILHPHHYKETDMSKGNIDVYRRLYDQSKPKQELGKKRRDEIAETSTRKRLVPNYVY